MDSERVKELINIFARIQKEMFKVPFNKELTKGEFFMLQTISTALEDEDKARVSKIGSHLKISKPAVSKMLSVLEEKGFVNRIFEPSDRRLIYIELTEHGKQALAKQRLYLQQLIDDFTTRLGKEDTEKLLELLQRIYEVIESMNQGKEDKN